MIYLFFLVGVVTGFLVAMKRPRPPTRVQIFLRKLRVFILAALKHVQFRLVIPLR